MSAFIPLIGFVVGGVSGIVVGHIKNQLEPSGDDLGMGEFLYALWFGTWGAAIGTVVGTVVAVLL